MLNELLRLCALALIAFLLAFAGLVSSQSTASLSCTSEDIADKADPMLCEDGVAVAIAPVDALDTP